jgi:Concanavalin A-like lectin/glucanases superfamily/Fibronectin type III domain
LKTILVLGVLVALIIATIGATVYGSNMPPPIGPLLSTNPSPAACIAPPSGLVGWWPGDGNANDIIGGNNGVLHGGVTFGPGEVGQAFSFNGTNGEVVVPHNPNQNTGGQITIDAWVYPTSAGHGRTIFQKRSPSNVGGYVFETTGSPFGPDNGLQFGVWIAGTLRGFQTPANILFAGSWQHVAATFNGTAMKVYVNGIERASNTSASGVIDPVTDPVVIGLNVVYPVSHAWDGFIDEVELYNRALAGSEIQAIFNAGSAGKCKPPTAPSAPQNLVATPGPAQVTLAWQAPVASGGSAITGYKVYRGTTAGGETLLADVGNVLTVTDSGLTSGNTYYYEISAANGVGEGPKSTEVSATPTAVPNNVPPTSGLPLPAAVIAGSVLVVILAAAVAAGLVRMRRRRRLHPPPPRGEP